MLSQKIEKILQEVQKPGRYVGGELNSVIKDKSKTDVRYAFCFPDTYEIGMSHLGMKILYSVVNRLDYAWCERVFAPDVDMEEKMRENGIKLWALESGDPLDEFDLIGFTLQYELSYTNILNMLVLSGISPDGRIVETVELKGDKFFLGAQFHPEFKSRPNRAHPLFKGFIKSCLE